MKSAKNELKQFVAGVVMLIVGLFILSQKVVVSSGWFGYGGTIMLGGVRLNSGMIMIPFIIGIIWMFASGASFASKLFTALSVILIVASIILNTNIYMVSISMYEWVVMLVLIFGGAGFVAKVLFSDAYKEEKHKGKKKGRQNSGMGNIQEYKCPCCGGAIHFDSTIQKMKCPYCDTEFEMEALRGYDEALNQEQSDEMVWDTSAGEE